MLYYVAIGLSILLILGLVLIMYRTIVGKPVERRIIFLYIALSVAIPFFLTIKPPIPRSNDVQQLVTQLKSLPAGSKVLFSFDYDAQSAPELQPMAVAAFKYALKHDLKPIIMGLWPMGPSQANMALRDALNDEEIAAKNLVEGVDYARLGFQSGQEFVIQAMGGGFKSMFPQDDRRMPYDSIPLLQNVVNFSNVDFVFNFSAGKPGTREWVQIAADRFGAKLGAGNTAVQAPEMTPFVRGGQLLGIAGGMTGAAELENSLGEPGKATRALLSQMFGHAVVMAFIIIGNVAFLRSRRKGAHESAPGGIHS